MVARTRVFHDRPQAQGQALDRVIVDLASCTGREPPYYVRVHQITKWQSDELRDEFSRLVHLKWMTIAKYGKNMRRGKQGEM